MKYTKINLLYLTLLFSAIIIGLFYFNVEYAFIISLILLGIEAFVVYFFSQKLQTNNSSKKGNRNYIDNLTNLPNRDKFFLDLKDAKGIILIDLDDFSLINMVYSKEFGDEFLKKLASKLRSNDKIENLYRIGGDEFTIISKEEKDLKGLAEDIIDLINDFYVIKDNILVQVTATVAISYSEPFIERADLALKYGKKHKLNLVVYSKELNIFEENKKFVDITMRLKQALKTNNVVPFFHCIKNNNEDTVMYEALMRIKDGEKYMLPELFMDIAKQTKLYTELTFKMITNTFEYMKDKDIRFSINISYDDILSKRIFNKIMEELDNFPYPHNVVIEFLETDKIENFEYMKYFIDEVHKRGAKIAIDDFGSGYSNFIYLEKLNIDIIKINGEIVSQILSSGNALLLVRNIVEFCKKNDIISIAEYVAYRDIYVTLKEIGVDEYQGFYFCKPKEKIV